MTLAHSTSPLAPKLPSANSTRPSTLRSLFPQEKRVTGRKKMPFPPVTKFQRLSATPAIQGTYTVQKNNRARPRTTRLSRRTQNSGLWNLHGECLRQEHPPEPGTRRAAPKSIAAFLACVWLNAMPQFVAHNLCAHGFTSGFPPEFLAPFFLICLETTSSSRSGKPCL